MRWPPARNGTDASAFCGALRIRSTPFGLARVATYMPPGLTIGMNTSRTVSSWRCSSSSQASRHSTDRM
jgi:hypothetical protein